MKQPIFVDADQLDVQTEAPIGMFVYIQNQTSVVGYDAEFRQNAQILLSERVGNAGNVTSTFQACNATERENIARATGLTSTQAEQALCSAIVVSPKFQTGSLNMEITKCDPSQ